VRGAGEAVAAPGERAAGGRPVGVGGLAGIVLLVLALLVGIVLLALSVRVTGTSMEPTLHENDRLEVEVFRPRDVARFDLVEASQPGERASGGGTRIVKRVIGLPGDQISVAEDDGLVPRVYLRPAGTHEVLLVDNRAWSDRIGGSIAPCCTADGRSTGVPTWVTVPPDSYWLIGDNWGGSTDSRVFGFVTKDEIRTRLLFRILPPSRYGKLTSSASLVPISGQ
jgi:signal peptidase I